MNWLIIYSLRFKFYDLLKLKKIYWSTVDLQCYVNLFCTARWLSRYIYTHIYICMHMYIYTHVCVCVLSRSVVSDSLQLHGLQAARLSVHGVFQERILEWVAISSSKRSSWPRDWTPVSCIGRQILYQWATWEAIHMHTHIVLHMCSLLCSFPLWFVTGYWI